MRRTNIRRKKSNIINNLNKKAFIVLLILSSFIIACLIFFLFYANNSFRIKHFESINIEFANLNKNTSFSINKISLFSSADVKEIDTTTLNISQYCDIGIYLNNSNPENNIIKSLYIDQINISNTEIGTPSIFSKSLLDFGKCTYNDSLQNNDLINFNIISSENEINYENLELYSNGTTPITLEFYNKNIKENFSIKNSNQISYNGTVLKEALIPLSSLKASVSFNINIITTNNEYYYCNVSFDIPLKNENEDMYKNGYITSELNDSISKKFIRTK